MKKETLMKIVILIIFVMIAFVSIHKEVRAYYDNNFVQANNETWYLKDEHSEYVLFDYNVME